MKNILFLTAFIFLFTSCEETMIMIPEITAPKTAKTVLIEDLTGVQCPNCPKGSAAIEQILDLFGENVYAIGIHGEQLTEPIPGESKYDFRNKFAFDLENFHKPFLGKPTALFNRVKFAGEFYIPVDNVDIWLSLVQKELEKDNQITVLIDKSYDQSSRKIDFTTTIIPLTDLTGSYKISVFVTESKIEDAQENQSVVIEDFEHNHVLRHMMTTFDGDILGSNLVGGVSVKKSYSYTIPEGFNPDNMEVIVSVTKNEVGDKTIQQSAGFKLK